MTSQLFEGKDILISLKNLELDIIVVNLNFNTHYTNKGLIVCVNVMKRV